MPRGTRLVSLALGLLAALLAALAGPVAMVAAAPHRDVDVSASAVGSAHAAADSAYSFFTTNAGAAAAGDRGDGHSNNWLVLVCTSRFWFNYRHVSNALAVYGAARAAGVPDSRVLVLLADDAGCNARNVFPAAVFDHPSLSRDLLGRHAEVDYRGYSVTVDAFLRLLTDRLPASVPASRRLLSDSASNVLLYLTGHGGDHFLKFQDADELTATALSEAIIQMRLLQRFHRLFLMVDTCQAGTMLEGLPSPKEAADLLDRAGLAAAARDPTDGSLDFGVIAAGSARRSQNSYSIHSDSTVGLSLSDRFTSILLESVNKLSPKRASLMDLFASLLPSEIMSHPVYRADLLRISATSAQSDNAWMCPSFRPSNVEYFMSPADDPSHAVRPSGDAMALASLRQEPIDAYFSARQRARAAGTVRTDILPGTGPAKPVDHVAEKDPPPSVDRIPTTVFGDARPVRLRSIRL